MAENKTRATQASVKAYLETIEDPHVQQDCLALLKMMYTVTRLEPVMWGSSIIGFGSYHYVYESGREGDTIMIGFSPRKQNIVIYLTGGLSPLETELARLGKHQTGKGCLYIKSLADVNEAVLKRILTKSFKAAQRKKRQGS